MEAQPEFEPSCTPKRKNVTGDGIALVMPNVIGLPVNQALAVLNACLLTSESSASITLDGSTNSLGNTTNTRLIATQIPAAGGTPTSTITLTSSDAEAGITEIYLPDVSGLAAPAAYAALDALGALCAAVNSGQRFRITVKLTTGVPVPPPYPSQYGVSETEPEYDPSTTLDPGGIVAVVIFDPFP